MGIVNYRPKSGGWGSCSEKESGSDSKKKTVEIRSRNKQISRRLIKKILKNKK